MRELNEIIEVGKAQELILGGKGIGCPDNNLERSG
jgi:hypothetical protein